MSPQIRSTVPCSDTLLPVFVMPDKTKTDRVIHALMFEVFAITLCAPTLAWIMNTPLFASASVTLMNALCAMAMNMIFNIIFDHFEKKIGFTRTVKIRILHAVLFEVALLAIIVPLGAVLLNVSLSASFFMNIGLALFFLPYTYFYNLAYDKLRYTYYFKRFMTAQEG